MTRLRQRGIPKGASFKDMVALKSTSDIGDQINKKIIEPLAKANKLSEMPDFNSAASQRAHAGFGR
jgi:type I restriction enzyme M protein